MNDVLTPEKFLEKMKKAYNKGYDIDLGHQAMDDIMCDLLRSLGYGKGVDFLSKLKSGMRKGVLHGSK